MSQADMSTNNVNEELEPPVMHSCETENVPLPVSVLIKEEVDIQENGEISRNDEEVQLPVNVMIKEEMEVPEDEEDSITDVEVLDAVAPPSPVHRVSKKEQRTCIKFCVLLRKSPAVTFAMLREAFGAHSIGVGQCYKYHKLYRKGDAAVLEDVKCTGRRRLNKRFVPKLRRIVSEEPALSVAEMSQITGLRCLACTGFTEQELKLRRIHGKLVPTSLTPAEKEERVSVCLNLRTAAAKDPMFISRIISCGESWFFGCHTAKCKKCQSPSTGVFWPKIPQGNLPSRGLLIVFFDVNGIVHWEFSPCTEVLDGKFYCEILSRLIDAMEWKRPALLKNNNWMLHHDNSPAHNDLTTRQFLADKCVTVVPHPQKSCAPDLTPWDIYFTEGLKMRMKARAITSPGKFHSALARDVRKLKMIQFEKAFSYLQSNWELCINSCGDYCNTEQE